MTTGQIVFTGIFPLLNNQMHELVSDGTNDIKLNSEDKSEGALYFGLNRSGCIENIEIRIKIMMRYRENLEIKGRIIDRKDTFVIAIRSSKKIL